MFEYLKGKGSRVESASVISANSTSRPPSYSSGDEVDAGSFLDGTSNGTQTPPFTPGATMYGGSEAGSTLRQSKQSRRHEAPHCKSCTCPSSATDPNVLKDANGRPYSRRQLIHASVSALETFNNTYKATLQAKQMRVMVQALIQSNKPYTAALFQNDGMFEPLNESQQNSEIRALIDPKKGFPDTLEEAFKATCEPNSQRARQGLKGFNARLQMARLKSDDEEDSD